MSSQSLENLDSFDRAIEQTNQTQTRNMIYTKDPNCFVNINKFKEENNRLVHGLRPSQPDNGTNLTIKSPGTKARTASNTRGSFFNESTSKNSKNKFWLDPAFGPRVRKKSQFQQEQEEQQRRPSSLKQIREESEQSNLNQGLFCFCLNTNRARPADLDDIEPHMIVIDSASRKSSEKNLTHMTGGPSQTGAKPRNSLNIGKGGAKNNPRSLFYNQNQIEVDLSVPQAPMKKNTNNVNDSSRRSRKKSFTNTISLSNIPEVPPLPITSLEKYQSIENMYKTIKDLATVPDLKNLNLQNLTKPLQRKIAEAVQMAEESGSIVVEVLHGSAYKNNNMQNSGSLRIKVMNNITGEILEDSLIALKNSSGGSITKPRRKTQKINYRKSLHKDSNLIRLVALNESGAIDSSHGLPEIKAKPKDDFMETPQKFKRRVVVNHQMNSRSPERLRGVPRKSVQQVTDQKKRRIPLRKAVTTCTNTCKEYRIMKPKFLKTVTRVFEAKRELIRAYLENQQKK